jgi:undecaprenyl-diphosphatase
MTQSLDLSLIKILIPWDHPVLDWTMIAISASGNGGGLWLGLGMLGLVEPRWRAAAWRVLLAVGLTLLIVDGAIKPVVARARPVALETAAARNLPVIPPSYSFPSGHTAASVAAAVALSRMWPAGRVVWWTLAALMAYSRVYLGHHYPLDVMGGAVVGMLSAFWVLGGRHPATSADTLPRPLPSGVVIRP